LVTGGAGFLGSRLVKTLLSKNSDISIKVIARNESEITNLMTTCSNDNRIHLIVGDIRNKHSMNYALQDVDTVFHLAAMKHIDLCELNPSEAISTNVIATNNLLNMFKGNTFIGISTDKAVEPKSCYGATKLLLEKLTMEKAWINPKSRRYIIVRSGNVFGSAGSVIPKWINQIKQYNKITITDLRITRFFIKVEALVSSIINIKERGESGKIYIPKQSIIRLGDLARAVIEVYGNKDTVTEITGLGNSEKLYERIFLKTEKNIVTTNSCETSDEQAGIISVEEIKLWLRNQS